MFFTFQIGRHFIQITILLQVCEWANTFWGVQEYDSSSLVHLLKLMPLQAKLQSSNISIYTYPYSTDLVSHFSDSKKFHSNSSITLSMWMSNYILRCALVSPISPVKCIFLHLMPFQVQELATTLFPLILTAQLLKISQLFCKLQHFWKLDQTNCNRCQYFFIEVHSQSAKNEGDKFWMVLCCLPGT